MSRVRPADFSPPFDPRDYVAPPTDPPEERIDVGILIIGAGPAGLACAIRLGQLLEDSPETAERLGEVPVAVLEKGKSVGAHSLSGAVVNPRALRRLFRERVRVEEMPFYGPVDREGVYYLTKGSALRIPAPPTMRNDGNYIASLSELTRWLGEQAEAGGAYILPETAAEKLLVDGARAVGARTGDKGRGRDGEPLSNFEPGSVGMVVGLDYRDTEVSPHDLLQQLKTHPLVRKVLNGGERIGWGAKTIPEGGFVAVPQRMHAPGLLITGDGAGFVNVPALKGIHYAIESGRIAAEAAFAALQRGRTPWTPGVLASYDEAIRDTFIWNDLKRVRNMRQAFGNGFWLGGAMAGAMTMSFGKFPPGNKKTERDAEQELIRTKRASRYPKPDGKLTFDKLSSVFLSGNKTRDDAPNHIALRTDVPEEVARMWEHMCPAQVYEAKEGGGVEVTPSNCVQCGAITAKGGRLTPPEGGAGPEYKLT